MMFEDLSIGDVFRFAYEESQDPYYLGMARGPWERISARKYRHVHTGDEHRVGAIGVAVRLVQEPNPSSEHYQFERDTWDIVQLRAALEAAGWDDLIISDKGRAWFAYWEIEGVDPGNRFRPVTREDAEEAFALWRGR